MFYSLAKPLIHALSPELAHNAALRALNAGLVRAPRSASYESLSQTLWNLPFANPVGMAAGFDKNAESVNPLLHQGFGFVEVGTCTPRPQEGNAKPRLYRLPKQKAVINRMGFNNKGAAVFVENLKRREAAGVVGANIGKNKTSDDAVADYVSMVEAVAPFSDYITINISSPNTTGLRDLQEKSALEALLSALCEARDKAGEKPPLLLKIAPDLSLEQLDDVVDTVLSHPIEGMIVSNTTIARPDSIPQKYHNEAGGLSGQPLFERSTECLRETAKRVEGKIPLVGVGGISNAEQAYAKIKAGASLVQIYSAFVYEGFGLVRKINQGLDALLAADGYSHISEAIGVDL